MAPSHSPVPCINGAPVIDTPASPCSWSPTAIGASSSALSGIGSPIDPNANWQKKPVIAPISYITPFGMPVVPPV